MHTETWLFLYSGYLKNYRNFFKSWARYFELKQVLLILVGVHQKWGFLAQKSWFICDSKHFRKKIRRHANFHLVYQLDETKALAINFIQRYSIRFNITAYLKPDFVGDAKGHAEKPFEYEQILYLNIGDKLRWEI